MGKVAKDGTTERVYLGASPTLDEATGLKALQAAKVAYNNGRGYWPTAGAPARIEAREKCVSLMKEKREEVSTLLMWEIAKNKSAAYQEFARPENTPEPIADLHNESHRQSTPSIME